MKDENKEELRGLIDNVDDKSIRIIGYVLLQITEELSTINENLKEIMWKLS